jgi:hypothetical protein
LCEGQPRLDENGEQVWEPTEYTTVAGLPVDRPVCDFIEDWDNNNVGLQEVSVQQTGSFVTAPCQNGEIGPRRNCDFVEIPFDEEANMCAVDRDVTRHFRVEDAEAPVVLRVCEYSDALGTGVACAFEDSVANVIIGDIATEVTFACPRIRDAEEFSGGYSFYVAPVWPEDELQELSE